jgi:DNA-binding CsgD family transcriptional regulator
VAYLGPPGSGRARLAAAQLARAGRPFVELRAHRGLAHLAYGALRDTLHDARGDTPGGLAVAADPLVVADDARRRIGDRVALVVDLDLADRPTVDLIELLGDHLPLVVTLDPAGPEGPRALAVVSALDATVVEVPGGDLVGTAVELRALPADRQRALVRLALLDRPAAPAILGIEDPAVLPAELVRVHARHADPRGRIQLAHRLVADAIVEAASRSQRRAAHAHLAAALADEDPGGAARHALAAGDHAGAARLARAAASAAVVPDEAALHLEVAALASRDDDLLVEAAFALLAAGRPERAAPLVSPLSSRSGDLGARAALALARAEGARGERERAGSVLAAARARRAAPSGAVDVDLLVEEALLAAEDTRGAGRALPLALDARRLAEQVGARRGAANALVARTLLAAGRQPSDPEVAQALAAARPDGTEPDDEGTAEALALATYAAEAFDGRAGSALAIARRQVRAARADGRRRAEIEWRLRAVHFELLAAARYRRALAELRRLDRESLTAREREQLDGLWVVALADTGDERAWRRILHERWRRPYRQPFIRWAAAVAEFTVGRYGEALRIIEEGRGEGRLMDPLLGLLERWALLLRGHAVPGELDPPPFASLAGVVPESQALVAWSEGRHRRAAERFAEAAAAWEGNLARDAWRCRLGEAETRHLAGDDAGAAERFAALLAEGRALGVVALAGPAEWGLRRCGVEPGPAPVPELTARQHEILRLVAGGATSTDIAARLHISARAVDKAVARAMHRLGARTRHQAAQLVAGEEPAGAAVDVDLAPVMRELLRHLAAGTTVAAAAHAVGLSRRTATRRLGELRRDLGVASTAAVLAALRGQLEA